MIQNLLLDIFLEYNYPRLFKIIKNMPIKFIYIIYRHPGCDGDTKFSRMSQNLIIAIFSERKLSQII